MRCIGDKVKPRRQLSMDTPRICLLRALAVDHPDRNRLLVGCFYRWRGKARGGWKEVLPSFRIAKCCYNDLGFAWTEHNDWCWRPTDAVLSEED